MALAPKMGVFQMGVDILYNMYQLFKLVPSTLETIVLNQ